MYQKIRITVAALAVMMICMLSSNATLSYFTDTEVTTNNFVVGNASAALAVYSDATGGTAFNAAKYTLVDNLDIPFYPQATNNGNIPVYQRFRVVIPIGLRGVITLNLPTMDDSCTIDTTTTSTCSNTNYTVTYNHSVEVSDTPTYAEYYIVSNSVLAVDGETVEWPVTGIHIGDLSSVDPALRDSLFTCTSGDNDCVLGIKFYSDVIQTTGFVDAAAAFASLAETY